MQRPGGQPGSRPSPPDTGASNFTSQVRERGPHVSAERASGTSTTVQGTDTFAWGQKGIYGCTAGFLNKVLVLGWLKQASGWPLKPKAFFLSRKKHLAHKLLEK